MPAPLTQKQWRVYEIVRAGIERGQCPSVREIADAIGVASSCSAYRHLDALVKKGLLRRRKPYGYRNYELTTALEGPRCPYCHGRLPEAVP